MLNVLKVLKKKSQFRQFWGHLTKRSPLRKLKQGLGGPRGAESAKSAKCAKRWFNIDLHLSIDVDYIEGIQIPGKFCEIHS